MSLQSIVDECDLADALRATATFEDVRLYQRTDKAVLVYVPDQGCGRRPIGEAWVPRRAIDRDSEVPKLSFGYLIVARWYAEKYGWVP